MTTPDVTAQVCPLTREQLEKRLKYCPRLPSLSTINSALRELLSADQRYTSQIAEIIRRDPSLTARLLRLVNSVYYGLSTPVNSIEEAVFYLGVRQIRQLVMVTPVIEDLQRLAGKTPFPWRDFWQHCIGTAILTREVISAIRSPADEVDYVAGLIHDVGKIALAAVCPEHFDLVFNADNSADSLLAHERRVVGLDHAELGAIYLRSHNLPDALVDVARFHHQPERATHHASLIAAVQIADLLVRHAGIGNSGDRTSVSEADWMNASGWSILYPPSDDEARNSESERALAHANLKRNLDRLPTILEGLV